MSKQNKEDLSFKAFLKTIIFTILNIRCYWNKIVKNNFIVQNLIIFCIINFLSLIMIAIGIITQSFIIMILSYIYFVFKIWQQEKIDE